MGNILKSYFLSELVDSLGCSYGKDPGELEVELEVAKVSNINGQGRFHKKFETRSFSQKEVEKLSCKKGDLLVVKSSGSKKNILSGKTAICDFEHEGTLVATNFLMRLRPNKELVEPKYLWYVLNSEKTKNFIKTIVGTTTYPNLKWNMYGRLKVELPTLVEQQRVTAILDKADEIKSKTQYSNEIRDGFIKSIFLEMFGDPRIQGNYPRKKFSDVAEVVTGTTPSTNHPEYYGGDVPFVKPPDLCGQVINKTITFLTSEGASKSRLIPKNSVMVSCIGILGKTALAGTSLCTNQQINSLIFNEEIIRPLFGFHYCSFIGELLDSMAPATTVPLVNKSRFSEIDIPIPPIELQLQFEKICVDFSSTITHDSQVEDLAISISQELLANQ